MYQRHRTPGGEEECECEWVGKNGIAQWQATEDAEGARLTALQRERERRELGISQRIPRQMVLIVPAQAKLLQVSGQHRRASAPYHADVQ